MASLIKVVEEDDDFMFLERSGEDIGMIQKDKDRVFYCSPPLIGDQAVLDILDLKCIISIMERLERNS